MGTTLAPGLLCLLSSAQHPRKLRVFLSDTNWFIEGNLLLPPLKLRFGLKVGAAQKSRLLGGVYSNTWRGRPLTALGMNNFSDFRFLKEEVISQHLGMNITLLSR